MDLHNLLHFLRLRMDSHAQIEIRTYANAIGELIKVIVPRTWEAFQNYRLQPMHRVGWTSKRAGHAANRRELRVRQHLGARKPIAIPKSSEVWCRLATFSLMTAIGPPIYKPGRSPAMIRQWESGRARFGERFVMSYYSSGSGLTGRSLDRPLGTVRTNDAWALVDGDRIEC